VEFGVYWFPTDAGAPVQAVARGVEERSLESLFVPEHSHFPASEEAFRDPSGKVLDDRYRRILDPFVALTAAAAVTSRIRLGTAACVVTQRDVILTAKAAASLDQVSGGRLLFGVGAGWNLAELRTHGVEPRRRFRRFDESIDAITEVWTKERAEFHGGEVDFGPIWSWPKPLQRPRPPVLIAGHGRSTLERVLARGDGWLPSHRETGDLAELTGWLRERAGELGRPSPTVTFVAGAIEAGVVDQCLRAGVDRILLPVSPGPEAATSHDLDECELLRGQFHD
jgi:probable F420-dependent oxidoreductase